MGVVNQRVCDLGKCAQPITAETKVTFVVPQGADGEPDLARRAEFQSPKCARTFIRQVEVSQNDARLEAMIADTPNSAANKEKIAGMRARVSGNAAVDFPKAAAA